MSDKILFVDDEKELLDLYAIFFQDLKDQLLFASSGIEAIELIKVQQVSLIISDISMTNGDGKKLLEYVKSAHPQTDFYFHSAHESIDSFRDPFIQGFFNKPVSFFELQELIAKYIKPEKKN